MFPYDLLSGEANESSVRSLLASLFAITFRSCFRSSFFSLLEARADLRKPAPSQPSDINVAVHDGGPIVITTSAAEFQILPSGFLQATLSKDGKRLTLDEPDVGSTGGSDSIVIEGKELDFVPDFRAGESSESSGKLGRGKRVEIPAHPLAPAGVPD